MKYQVRNNSGRIYGTFDRLEEANNSRKNIGEVTNIHNFFDTEQPVDLKDFRAKINSLGYKVKTRVSGRLRFLTVLTKNGEFVFGSGANITTTETIQKNNELFDYMKQNRGNVFDYSYEPPLKVIF